MSFLWLLMASADWISTTFGGTVGLSFAFPQAGGRSLKSIYSQLSILSTTFLCRVGIPLPSEILAPGMFSKERAVTRAM